MPIPAVLLFYDYCAMITCNIPTYLFIESELK